MTNWELPTPISPLTSEELRSAIVAGPLVVSPETGVIEAIATMSGQRAECAHPRTPDGQLEQLHREARSSCVIVMEQGQIVGMLTARDVVRLATERQPLEILSIQQVMTQPVEVWQESDFTDVFVMADYLQKRRIRHLPILDKQGQLIGLVTHDSLQYTAQRLNILRLRQVSEVMTSDVICASLDGSLLEIAEQMATHQASSVVLVEPRTPTADSALLPVGMITERDLVQFQALELSLATTSVQTVMNSPLFTVQPSDSLWSAQNLMAQHFLHQVVVTGDQGELLGLVTQGSLLKTLNPLEVLSLATALDTKVQQLEVENAALLSDRNRALEQLVAVRTAELQQQVERSACIARVASQIRDSLDLQTILDVCVGQLRTLVDCDRMLIYQFQADWSGIIVAESVATGWRQAWGNHITDSCFQQQSSSLYNRRSSVVVNNVDQAGYSDCHRQLLAEYQVKANLVIPIHVAGELWGLLIGHHCRDHRNWQLEAVSLLEEISVQLSIGIHQANTHQTLQAELRERHRVENCFRESENRYRSIYEQAAVGFANATLEGNLIDVNPQLCKMLGYSREELLQKSLAEIIHPDDRLKTQPAAESLLSGESPYFFQEKRYLRRDGHYFWSNTGVSLVRNAVGEPKQTLTVIQDISEQKLAENALKDSERRFRNMAANVPGALFRYVLHPDGTDQVLYMSPGCYELWEVTAETAVNSAQCLWDMIHPDDVAATRTSVLASASQLRPWSSHWRIITPSGKRKWLEAAGRPEYQENGDVIWDSLILDVSDRKRVEQELQLSLTALDRHFDTSLLAIIEWDNHRQIKRWSKEAERIFGWSEAEIKTMDMAAWQFVYEEDFDEVSVRMQALRDGSSQHGRFENRNYRKDGVVITCEWHASAVFDEDGNLHSILSFAQDITERKQAEVQLQNLISGTAATTGQDFFPALVSHIGLALDVAYVLVTEQVGTELQTLAYWADGSLKPNFSFSLAGTPCERVQRDGILHWEHCVQDAFPANLDLVEMGVTSYLGVALYDTHEQTIGNLCILDRKPIQEAQRAEQILRVFAARGGAEIERQRAISQLEKLNQNLETTIQQRTAKMKQNLAAISASIDGIGILRDGIYLYVNQAYLDLFSYLSSDAIVGKTWQVLYSPEEAQRFDQEIFPQLHRNRAWQGEAIAMRQDGSTFIEELSLTLAEDGLLISICRDITEQKQLELALQRSEDQLRDVLDSAIAGIIRLKFYQDRSVKYDYISPHCERNFGYTVDELMSDPNLWRSQIYPDDWKNVVSPAMEEILEHHHDTYIHVTEYRFRQKGGKLCWILSKCFSQWNDDEGYWYLTIVETDISDRKQAEAQLQHTNEKLLRATQLKDEFLANMSHELRTPLNAILGMSEALQECVYGEFTIQQKQAAEIISSSGRHLLDLINDILDLSKIEAGQVDLNLGPVAVSSLCQASLIFVKQQALQKNIQLEAKLPSKLPLLQVDGRRTRQILINLLVNAVKFTPNGGKVTLEVSDELQDAEIEDGLEYSPHRYLNISIHDTGIGIAPEHLDRLFQPFIQIDSALNRQYAGAGLGLALVKRIVDLHGGTVTVASELGQGSCFTVKLPCVPNLPQAFAPSTAEQAQPEPSVSISESGSPLILLAEDNEASLLTFSHYLGAKGYSLVTAKDGSAAVELAQAQPPHLILMDIQMPGMDGLEAIKHIRNIPRLANIPIIALTALAMNGDREICLQAGADDYLAKPVKLKQLVSVMEQLLTEVEQ